MVNAPTNSKTGSADEPHAKINTKQRKKEDAQELAHLIYDIFMENQANDNMNNRGEK